MANTDRRMPDMQDKMFFPKSIDGGASDDSFFGGFKLTIVLVILIGNILNILYCIDSFTMSIMSKIITIIIWLFISQLIIRYFILNERYFYGLYVRMKNSKVLKPSAFWGIVAFEDNIDGCVVTFQDLKVGVYVKLHRDSITGRQLDIKEVHYDAISDFYAKINKYGLGIKKLDLMEPVGNDPRLMELDKLVGNCGDNQNLKELVSIQVAYTKYLTRVNMYESEYVLIHSINYNERGQKLIQYAEEALQELMNGCYSGYTILDRNDIEELVKENYGVKLFDSNKATIDLFKRNGNYKKAFKIVAVGYKDGTIEELDGNNRTNNKLNKHNEATNKKALKGRKGKVNNKDNENPVNNESIENQILQTEPDENIIDVDDGIDVFTGESDDLDFDYADNIEIEIITDEKEG